MSTKENPFPVAFTNQQIRAQFLADVEQAAEQLENPLQGSVIDSLAYRQGQRDERSRILGQLRTWREQIPEGRTFAPIRNALTTILQAIQP
jgi:hypothetical protein